MTHAIDVARCERLVPLAADGDVKAWQELVEHLWPHWVRLVTASPAMRRLVRDEDHVHNVVASLVEKIGGRGGRGLRLFTPWRDRNAGKTFEDWFLIVTANVVRDYVRARASERAASRADADPSVKGLLNEFALSPLVDRIGVRPPYTAAQTARQLLELAEKELPAEQFDALTLWLQGAGYEQLGGGSADEARRLVRAACASLRRRFAAP